MRIFLYPRVIQQINIYKRRWLTQACTAVQVMVDGYLQSPVMQSNNTQISLYSRNQNLQVM